MILCWPHINDFTIKQINFCDTFEEDQYILLFLFDRNIFENINLMLLVIIKRRV